MKRVVASLAVTIALVAGGVARGASLDGFDVTMQFNGDAHTVWSFPPTDPADDGCFLSTQSGSGSQSYDYSMAHRRVYLHIVDAGATIAFQLPNARQRANQHHSLDGFREAGASRIGNIKTVYSKSTLWTTGCGAVPEESFADTIGCGDKAVPWDMTPIDAAGRFYPQVAAYPPSSMLSQCPFYGPSDIGVPTETHTAIPLSELRHVLGKKNGKLIIQSHHRWQTEGKQGSYELTITTTVDWKMILIRAHPR